MEAPEDAVHKIAADFGLSLNLKFSHVKIDKYSKFETIPVLKLSDWLRLMLKLRGKWDTFRDSQTRFLWGSH